MAEAGQRAACLPPAWTRVTSGTQVRGLPKCRGARRVSTPPSYQARLLNRRSRAAYFRAHRRHILKGSALKHLPSRARRTGCAPPCASRPPVVSCSRPGRCSSVIYEAGASRASAACRPRTGPGETKQTRRGRQEGVTVRPGVVNRWAGCWAGRGGRLHGTRPSCRTKKRGDERTEAPGSCLGQLDGWRRRP